LLQTKFSFIKHFSFLTFILDLCNRCKISKIKVSDVNLLHNHSICNMFLFQRMTQQRTWEYEDSWKSHLWRYFYSGEFCKRWREKGKDLRETVSQVKTNLTLRLQGCALEHKFYARQWCQLFICLISHRLTFGP
jgi:L-rhamnose mutarotase